MDLLIEVLGWTGQACFAARFLLQWWHSERKGRIVVPRIFWWLSLCGALLGGVFAFHKENVIFLASPVINLFVYGRNLVLDRTGRALPRGALIPLAVGILALVVIVFVSRIELERSDFWLVTGSLGTVCWVGRFPLQWWISEHLGRATLGPAFFWVSFAGSILLLGYAIHTRVPLFIVGMALTPLLYGRNLILVYRQAPVGP